MAYDAKWIRLSRAFKRANPICCTPGCGKPTRLVDHIVPVRVAPHRKYDRTNWRPFCQNCHNRITAAYEKRSLDGACDIDGNPLDPWHPWAQADNAHAIEVANTPKAERTVDPKYAAELKERASRER